MSASPELDLAGLGSRLVASILDGLLIWATLLPALILMLAFGGPDVIERDYPVVMALIVVITAVLFFGVALGQWVLLALRGQSLGKIALGIKIVRTDGTEAGFVHAVALRIWPVNFVAGVLNQCCLGWVVLLVDIIPIFAEDRRCLHDHLADTVVVRLP